MGTSLQVARRALAGLGERGRTTAIPDEVVRSQYRSGAKLLSFSLSPPARPAVDDTPNLLRESDSC
jgi:hypothetical protein